MSLRPYKRHQRVHRIVHGETTILSEMKFSATKKTHLLRLLYHNNDLDHYQKIYFFIKLER